MTTFRRSLLFFALLAGAAALLPLLPRRAAGDAPADEPPDTGRRPGERLRADPEHYARLKREWQAFQELPEPQQARLRKLDEELHSLEPAAQARLWAVLYRYTAWLEKLPDEDRRQIESAPDKDRKLELIRALREREWIARLPRAQREAVETAQGEARTALIAHLRRKERERRAEWQQALRLREEAWPPRFNPRRLSQFTPEVQEFVRKSLMPTLSPEERKRLEGAEHPLYAQTLAMLARQHPILLPPAEKPGVTAADQLPPDFRQRLYARLSDRERFSLLMRQGRWPDFALRVVELARAKDVPLPEKPLGPGKPEGYTAAVQEFLKQLQQDNPEARDALAAVEGKWPEYPQTIMRLANDYGRQVPGTYLPGPAEFWGQALWGRKP